MFAIHQRLRRRICQAGFCMFCVLPTSGLLAWTASLKTAAHAQRCQTELNQWLGFETRFERVRYPQPGESLYERFELIDPETRLPVVRCRALGVIRTDRKLVLEPSDIELSAGQAKKLARLLIRRLTRELPSDKAIWLVPTSVTLQSDTAEQTYDDVECRIESDAGRSSATLRFRLPGVEAGEPPMLSVVRTTSGDALKTLVKLDTMSATLPLSIFAAWIDLQPHLGHDAAFRGSLTAELADEGWSGEVSGIITNVDFDRLVASRFPHHLAGSANIVLDGARIHNGKLVEAAGQILSDSGTIGGSLLLGAVQLLDCPPRAALPGRPPFVESESYQYRDMSIDFVLDESGLILSASPDAPAGAIILDEHGDKLLAAPTSGPAPLIQLVKLLVPSSAVQVPATKETAALVPWLPLPAIVPPADNEEAPRSLPLRVD